MGFICLLTICLLLVHVQSAVESPTGSEYTSSIPVLSAAAANIESPTGSDEYTSSIPVLSAAAANIESPTGSDEYTSFIHKECAADEVADPDGFFSQALSSLLFSLVSQSKERMYGRKTTKTISNTTLTGLFQCRGDLTSSQCYNCVSRLPNQLCGKATASRVQLSGCYLLYEVAGFSSQISGMAMWSKTCGKSYDTGTGFGFEEKRDKAFGMMQNGVIAGNGFYATTYAFMYVLGQCEGDLGDTDCSSCIKKALEKAQEECRRATSGQLYLQKCFVTYSDLGDPNKYKSPSLCKGATLKTIAIVLGAAAGVGLLVTLFRYARDHYAYYV